MAGTIFSDLKTVGYEGPDSKNALSYRWYDASKVVLGKPMRDHLRFAIAYWHSFAMNGSDPFGGPTLNRPWMGRTDVMQAARDKADAAFDLFRILDLPFYTFHDRDIAPEGDDLRGSLKNFHDMVEYLQEKMESSPARLLWGTANLFSHPRFMAGAATNPDPDVFAYSATTVKHCMDATKALGGANYVLWGGREGYETLLNTDLRRELDQMGRFLNLVVEYKHAIGFQGQILIEPKPKEPTVHQYDFDTATVYGFLKKYGLEKEVKVNLEANHALLAGHTFEHEIAMAAAFDILGSLDMNRGDPLLGWDTDQFPNDLQATTLAMYQVILAGGIGQGGLNFDAKIRRQSIDPEDLVYAHIGAVDLCAKAFLKAAEIISADELSRHVMNRYAGWESSEAKAMLSGELKLDQIASKTEAQNSDPKPRSGQQERLGKFAEQRTTINAKDFREIALIAKTFVKTFSVVPLLFTTALCAQQLRLDLDLNKPGNPVSPTLYGLMIEEINHSIDGGLYAELIQYRAFHADWSGTTPWDLVSHGFSQAT